MIAGLAGQGLENGDIVWTGSFVPHAEESGRGMLQKSDAVQSFRPVE
jgi:2-keto-4-pentenoate hydratase